jgi:hypothetical protein
VQRVRFISALAVAPLLALCACEAPSLCDPERYPDVEVDGDALYVDAERGWVTGPGTCEQPFAEISAAVASVEGPATILVAPGEYGGDVVVEHDLTVIGVDRDQVQIDGTEASIGAQSAGVVRLQQVDLHRSFYGLWADHTDVELVDVDLTFNTWFGAYVRDGDLSCEGCRVLDNGPGGPGEISGGVLVERGAMTFHGGEVRRNAGSALWSVDASLDVQGTVVSDTLADALNGVGRGIEASASGESVITVAITDTVVERYVDAGVAVSGVELTASGVTISAAQACDTRLGGVGLYLRESTSLLEGVSADGACGAGLWALDGGSLEAEDLTVSDTAPGEDALGLAVRIDGVQTSLTDSYLGGSTGVGLMASCAPYLLLDGTDVSDTAAAGGDLGGDAVVVGDTLTAIVGGSLTLADRCGVRLVGGSGLDVSGATFDAAVADICVCDQELGASWEEAFVEDNTPTEDGVPVWDADEDGSCPDPAPGECG